MYQKISKPTYTLIYKKPVHKKLDPLRTLMPKNLNRNKEMLKNQRNSLYKKPIIGKYSTKHQNCQKLHKKCMMLCMYV